MLPGSSVGAVASVSAGPTPETAIAVYSTYLSEDVSKACAALQEHKSPCEEDAIQPDTFLSVLMQEEQFSQVVASGTEQDYELLIANQAAVVDTSAWWQRSVKFITASTTPLPTEFHLFTEVTLQWRGVEIDSQLIRTVADSEFRQHQQHHAQQILELWLDTAEQRHLFSAEYLYRSVKASDYLTQMRLPDHIENFTQSDTQLYRDPFKGVISRYVHPAYENALLDISVSPIVAPLTQDTHKVLWESLEKEHRDAELIARARGLELKVDSPIQPTALNMNCAGCDVGFMLALSAQSADEEPLYATTYVFRQHDKIIKLSATFPATVADALVAEAMPQIHVPTESPLMSGLRKLLEKQSLPGES
ncbi:hypothetical protein DXV75_02160 [Alteromonas aestuariivivens]|uniref:Uncharacterized protein n=1 Tax=Alteromonas aestuariivivens TaxID=1938339 RepID=A0A3D8MEU7_9ALTE|nr:hypothetical protein DXV75_02160 [Alteromonas aestuariivivens]